MTKLKIAAAILFGLLLIADCFGEDFGTDYNKAVNASAKDGKTLVVAIGATW